MKEGRLFDLNGCRVHGPLAGQKVRAFWRDGKLYVAYKDPLRAASMETSEPVKAGGGYRMYGPEMIIITVQPSGCGSCKQKELSAKVLSQERIMEMAG